VGIVYHTKRVNTSLVDGESGAAIDIHEKLRIGFGDCVRVCC
jgi:hypothetical protein